VLDEIAKQIGGRGGGGGRGFGKMGGCPGLPRKKGKKKCLHVYVAGGLETKRYF